MRSRLVLIGAAIAGVAGGLLVGWSTFLADRTSPAAAAPPAAAPQTAQTKAPQVGADEFFLGNADAKVTIIEYASMTCPHCAQFHKDTLPKIKAQFIDTGKARLVFRDFPFDEAGLRAAMLARCGGKEKFFGFLDVLFRTQDSWTRESEWRPQLQRMAKLSGMSDTDFDACLANKDIETKILDKRIEAMQSFAVRSTPTFFVNGERINGSMPFDDFAKLIRKFAPDS